MYFCDVINDKLVWKISEGEEEELRSSVNSSSVQNSALERIDIEANEDDTVYVPWKDGSSDNIGVALNGKTL